MDDERLFTRTDYLLATVEIAWSLVIAYFVLLIGGNPPVIGMTIVTVISIAYILLFNWVNADNLPWIIKHYFGEYKGNKNK